METAAAGAVIDIVGLAHWMYSEYKARTDELKNFAMCALKLASNCPPSIPASGSVCSRSATLLCPCDSRDFAFAFLICRLFLATSISFHFVPAAGRRVCQLPSAALSTMRCIAHGIASSSNPPGGALPAMCPRLDIALHWQRRCSCAGMHAG